MNFSNQSFTSVTNKFFNVVFAADIDRNAIMNDAKCKWEITYGECSKSCGGGTRIKHKKKVPVDGFDGLCAGYDTEEEECNVEPCPGMNIVMT